MKTIQDIYTKQVTKNLKQFKLKSDTDKLKYMTKNLKLLNFSIDKLRTRADILCEEITNFENKTILLGKLIIKEDFIMFEKEFFK